MRVQYPGWNRRNRVGIPAVVVDAPVSDHLEVLRVMCGRRVGVRFVEGVDHTDAFDWFLFDAVDVLWRTDTHRFQNRRHDVNHMVKLRADPAGIADVTRPRDRQALSRAAEVGGDLFGPPE